MVKAEWGKKRICPACGLKYYDFNNSPITCPACKIEFDPDIYLRSRKGKSLSQKNALESNEEISNLDEIETDEEVVSDDDPILDISKDDKDNDGEVEIEIEDDLSFISDDEISEEDDLGDDDVTVEVIDNNKD